MAMPQVEVAEQQDGGGVDELSCPAHGHVHAADEDDVGDVGSVECQRRQLQGEGTARVARAGDGLEVDERRDGQHVGGAQHPQRLDRGCPQPRHVGVDAEHRVGEEAAQGGQGGDKQIGQPDVLADEPGHLGRVARPDKVAHQRPAGRGKGTHHHEQQSRYAAHNVGDGQRLLPQVLYIEEEQKPGGQRHAVLYHRPQRHAQHPPEGGKVEARQSVQSILPQVDVPPGVHDEEHQRHRFGQRRPYGRARNAQGRKAQVAEDEDVVEHHVAQHHHDGVQRQRLGLRGAEEEGAEHHRVEREQRAEYPPMQVACSRFVYLRRRDDALQYDGREEERQHKHHHRHGALEVDAVVEQAAYLPVLAFAVAPGHEYLRPDAEAESHHEDDDVEHARDGRRPKLHLAHAAQEGCVRHANHLLHQEADKDRVGYVPYLAVGVSSRYVCRIVHKS